MEIEIKKENKTYQINLIPKKMRRMILRYRDGQFYLSVPSHLSLLEVRDWLEKLDEKTFDNLKSHYKLKQSDEFVFLFGKKYTLIHRPMHMHCVVIKDNEIRIYDDKKEEAIDHFLQEQLEIYIASRLDDFYQMGYLDFVPDFKIQKLRSKYGACFYQKGLIKFALMLAHETKEVIDSIMIHEIGHFYYPNHSQDFYTWVKEHDPNFDRSQLILKNGGAGDDSINEQ